MLCPNDMNQTLIKFSLTFRSYSACWSLRLSSGQYAWNENSNHYRGCCLCSRILYLNFCPWCHCSVAFLWNCGWHGLRIDVCTRCLFCWLLVWQEKSFCHRSCNLRYVTQWLECSVRSAGLFWQKERCAKISQRVKLQCLSPLLSIRSHCAL